MSNTQDIKRRLPAKPPGASRPPLAIISLVLLCSCQTLPHDTGITSATQDGGAVTPVAQIAQPIARPAAHSRPAVIQPVAHHHHSHAPHGHCPCCGPGTLPSFAFTGHGYDESLGPWKPDGIKGPWPKDEYV